MKVWLTIPGKEPQPAEMLVEDKGNIEWVVVEDGLNTSYDHETR